MNLYVKKRNGTIENFDKNKISLAILSTMDGISDDSSFEKVRKNLDLEKITNKIKDEVFINHKENDIIDINSLEKIIENVLGEEGEFEIFKKYVLFSEKKKKENLFKKEDIKQQISDSTLKVTKRNGTSEFFDISKLKKTFELANKGYKKYCKFDEIEETIKNSLIENITTENIHKILIKATLDKISVTNINWQNVAGRLALFDLYKLASINRKMEISTIYNKDKFVELIDEYIKKGLYYKDFYKYYTVDDFKKAASYLEKSRDWNYTYSIITMYKKRYLLNPNKVIKELPQEMYMMAALFLAIPEKPENRISTALKIYDYTSTGKISLPTPTLLNARTNYNQLSSCFILNTDDDLRGIYHNIENMAQISKFGGGIGVYLGNIRSRGSSIRGYKGASGGVNPWIKVINDTAIACNQLGSRMGSISVTLDIFHKDIFQFLDLQTETGDIRGKSFDIFPAVSIPDLFMKRVKENGKWSLFDPKEIEDKTGKKLQDHFGKEFEKFYIECENNSNLELVEVVDAKEVYKKFLKTTVETGMPYTLFRDTANELNPNKHAGNIYASNLCVTGDTRIHTEKGIKKIGDLYKEYKEIPLNCTIDNRTDFDINNKGTSYQDTIGIYKTAENVDIFEIITKDGYKIKSTEWHKYYKAELKVQGKNRIKYSKSKIIKVPLKELKIGDKLLIQSGEGQFGKKGSYDLGLLSGLIVGDGTFSLDKRNENEKWKAYIDLYNNEIELKDDIYKALHNVIKEFENTGIFKINTNNRNIGIENKEFYHTENSKKVRIESSRLGQILNSELNLNGKNKLNGVSEYIFEGKRDMIIGFLQGLFTADGHIIKRAKGNNGNIGIGLASISKKLLEDVQILLINFGIRSKIYKLTEPSIGKFKHTKKDGTVVLSKTKGAYRIVINGINAKIFSDKIGFIGFKDRKLKEIVENKGFHKYKNESYLTEIKEINYIGKEDVYDTTQDYNNSLIFNGIVTGNCQEIQQNTSPAKFIEEEIEDGKIVIKYEPGDTVVCNLASINVAKVNTKEEIKKVLPIAMRILDNVITLNFYPTKEAEISAMKYRPVGLGFLGLAEYLAVNKLQYDSKEARDVVDKLFELYSFETINASCENSKEKGAYSKFDGSEWSKGIFFGKNKEWFEKNSEMKTEWIELIEKVKTFGLRNGYLLSPAPNTSTALVIGTTASVMPIYKKYFVETNSVSPTINVAPNLNSENFWFYKESINMNLTDVIDMISVIYKWIDQSISFEFLINPAKVTPKDISGYYFKCWEEKIKTVYYVRSMNLDVKECVSCSG